MDLTPAAGIDRFAADLAWMTSEAVVTGTAARDASMGISLSVIDDDGLFANGFEIP